MKIVDLIIDVMRTQGDLDRCVGACEVSPGYRCAEQQANLDAAELALRTALTEFVDDRIEQRAADGYDR